MKKSVDYLIVGQGLAGTFLAFELLRQKKTICVIDRGHLYSSSRVAAGIINPIVLRRYTPTWRANEFLAYNPAFYSELDSFLGEQFYYKMPMEKLISSDDEKIFWEKRCQDNEVKDYLEEKLESVDLAIQPTQNFAIGKVKNTAWVNIGKLISTFRKKLLSKNLLMEELFDYDQLTDNQYQSTHFNKIIFCEGAKGQNNPYFPTLPFSLNKGQLINIKSSTLPKDKILKKKVFILPVEESTFKIGATYAWDWEKSSEEKAHKKDTSKTKLLKEELEEITKSGYELIEENVGIRPSIKDRRPLIGKHREKPNYYIFNGMGTRGCFMAPLLSKELVDFCERNLALHPEMDINRFLGKV